MNYNSDDVIAEGDNYLYEQPTIKKIERIGCDGISELLQMFREYYWLFFHMVFSKKCVIFLISLERIRKILQKKVLIIYKHIEIFFSNLLKKCLRLKTGLEYRLSKKKRIVQLELQ